MKRKNDVLYIGLDVLPMFLDVSEKIGGPLTPPATP